jgi:RNA polymerase-binding transcription factor DksA
MRREGDRQSTPRWRAILEARWRIRLQEVTELSLAYHAAAADILAGVEDPRARLLLHRAIEARQRLADTEDALDRVAAGDFGRCEQCRMFIAEVELAVAPESRYCAGCAGGIPAAEAGAEEATTGWARAADAAAGSATTGWARAGCTTVSPAAGRR